MRPSILPAILAALALSAVLSACTGYTPTQEAYLTEGGSPDSGTSAIYSPGYPGGEQYRSPLSPTWETWH